MHVSMQHHTFTTIVLGNVATAYNSEIIITSQLDHSGFQLFLHQTHPPNQNSQIKRKATHTHLVFFTCKLFMRHPCFALIVTILVNVIILLLHILPHVPAVVNGLGRFKDRQIKKIRKLCIIIGF